MHQHAKYVLTSIGSTLTKTNTAHENWPIATRKVLFQLPPFFRSELLASGRANHWEFAWNMLNGFLAGQCHSNEENVNKAWPTVGITPSVYRSDSKNVRLVGSSTVALPFAHSGQVFFILRWLKAHNEQETPTPKISAQKVLLDTSCPINHEQKWSPLDDSAHEHRKLWIQHLVSSNSSNPDIPRKQNQQNFCPIEWVFQNWVAQTFNACAKGNLLCPMARAKPPGKKMSDQSLSVSDAAGTLVP